VNWFVAGLAIFIASIVVGWWILPSPLRCLGFDCDYVPGPALVLRQHPLSWTQVAVMVGGLSVAFFVSVLGVYRARTHRVA
jgi:hypothetical protein